MRTPPPPTLPTDTELDAELERFIVARRAMLVAATVDATLAYFATYEPAAVERHKRNSRSDGDHADVVLMAGVHKARLNVTDDAITDELKAQSRAWLLSHGFKTTIQ